MSIASRITSMENNIRNAYHGLDSIGIDTTNTNKNIENISALLEDFYDSLPKVSGTGSNIQLTPTKKGRITSQINGDTFQQTYTGKNLFNYTQTEINKTWYGTNNGSRARYYITYTPGTDYTISIKNLPTEVDGIAVVEASNITSSSGSVYSNNIIGLTEFTHTFSTGAVYLVLQFSASTTLTRKIANKIELQIETGSTATSFEPYVGGTASPNPEFPQNIESVTGLQKVGVCGKNLFDKNNINKLNAQINRNTLKLVTDGNARTLWIKIQPSTTYTVSKTASARFRVATLSTQPQIDASITKYESDDSGTTLTITSEENDYYLAVMYYNVTLDTLTEQQILDTIQIEKGSTATTYEPYSGETYPINLGDIELNKIVNADYISGTPNNWIKNNRTGIEILKGTNSENYVIRNDVSISGYTCFRYASFDYTLIGNKTNGYSNYFGFSGSSNVADKFRLIKSSGYGIQFIISNDIASDVTSLKNWLSTHNVIIEYDLATPTTEPITDTTLINDLNNFYYAMSKNGETNISVDGNLPIILDVSALKYTE